MDFTKLLHGFVKNDTWIFLSCYMDLSKLLLPLQLQLQLLHWLKLLHGFVKIGTLISLSCYMDLSKLLHGFVKVLMWICQSCSMYFLPFALCFELNALGPLCL